MIRTVAIVEQRPYATLATVAFLTLFFGFIVQAVGSAHFHWTADASLLQYRTTLSYTSAIVGDAVILPIVNVLIVSQLLMWRRSPKWTELAGAALGAAVLTTGVHLYQAANALLNWTMLAPYQWTALGYAHAAFMFAELTLVLFFWGQVALVGREQPRAIFSHRVLLVVLCSVVFLRLLLGDYGYFG